MSKFKDTLNRLLRRNDMKYDAFKLCTAMEGYYEVDPAVMYPATTARIQEVLAGDPPVEIVSKDWTGIPWRDPVVERTIKEAETIADWNSAEGLAFARSWFQRALALAAGHGVRVHYQKNLDYRR